MHTCKGAAYECTRARVPLGRAGRAGDTWAVCRNVPSHVGCYKVVNHTITRQPRAGLLKVSNMQLSHWGLDAEALGGVGD